MLPPLFKLSPRKVTLVIPESMAGWLNFQNWILDASPGLLPVAAIIYSTMNSWHCSLMCGPFAYAQKARHLHGFLLMRLIAYTMVGGVMGFIGRLLQKSLEFQAFRGLAFFLLCFLTIVFVVPQVIPNLPRLSLTRFVPMGSGGQRSSMWVRGALLAALPCHLLAFYYGVAALTGSFFAGAAMLFIHAVMTTPALAYTQRVTRAISQMSWVVQYILRGVLLLLIALNLFYFAGRLLNPEGDVHDRILFCF